MLKHFFKPLADLIKHFLNLKTYIFIAPEFNYKRFYLNNKLIII